MIGKVEKEVAKASSLMEGVEAEIGKKRAVSRKVGCLGGWVGGYRGRLCVLAMRAGVYRVGAVLHSQCLCRVRLLVLATAVDS